MRDDDEAARAYTGNWCAHGDIGYADLPGGGRVRYLIAGSGPPLVLLHTVRTQLDHFQFVLPRLVDSFTVCAIDFPGMGWSCIVPGARYDEPALRAAVTTVINHLALDRVTLAGESMGGTVSLTVAADLGDRVRRVMSAIRPTARPPRHCGGGRANTYSYPDDPDVRRRNVCPTLRRRIRQGDCRRKPGGDLV